MKELKIILVVLLILTPLSAVFLYIDAMRPIWVAKEEQKAAIELKEAQANAAVDIKAHEERSQTITGLLMGVGSGFIFLLFGFGGVLIWKQYDKRRESWARAVDGTFALQTFKGSNGQMYITDPNKSVFGVLGFDKPSGQLITDASIIGPDRQLDYAKSVQKTRTTSAASGAGGFKYAAQGKFLAGAYDKTARAEAEKAWGEGPQTPWQPLKLTDAFDQSSFNNWILGQSPDNGELYAYDPRPASHFGIVGAPGTGKTACMAMLLMVNALRDHYTVIVLDGKGGADWSKYNQFVEYRPLDYTNVREYVGNITAEYERRQAHLNKYGANNIWELPKGTRILRPVLILIDEFGAVMDSLRSVSRTEYTAVTDALERLLRLTRAAGITFVLCDQNPGKWPGSTRGIFQNNICFWLGGQIGAAIQEYNLHKLAQKGQFQVKGKKYDAYTTYMIVDELLPVDYRKPKALLTGPSTHLGLSRVSRVDKGEGSNRILPPPPTLDDTLDGQANGHITTLDSTLDHTLDVIYRIDSTLDGASPPLTGKPISQKDKALVRDTYAAIGKYKETSIALWGSWHQGRTDWIKEVLEEQS